MPDDSSTEPIERWTAKRRATLVLSILKGEISTAEAARRHGLTVAEVEDWRDRFLVVNSSGLVRPRFAGRVILCPTINPGGLIQGEHYTIDISPPLF